MLQSNITDLKEKQGAARRDIEEMRRQLKERETTVLPHISITG